MDNKPVRVIVDRDGYLVRAGDPLLVDKQIEKEIIETIQSGGTVKTIPYEEYKNTEWKWVWEK